MQIHLLKVFPSRLIEEDFRALNWVIFHNGDEFTAPPNSYKRPCVHYLVGLLQINVPAGSAVPILTFPAAAFRPSDVCKRPSVGPRCLSPADRSHFGWGTMRM